MIKMWHCIFIVIGIFLRDVSTASMGLILSATSNPALNSVSSLPLKSLSDPMIGSGQAVKTLSSKTADAQQSSYKNEKVNALIAAYIYYFTKFVYWPDNSKIKKICVVGGSNSLLDEFKKIAKKSSSHIYLNHLSYVVFSQSAPEYKVVENCHLLYITENYQGDFLLDPPKNFNGLLVVDEFMRNKHAVIRLVMNGKKLSFEISRSNAQKKQLYVSAKLLGLAKAVID